MQGYNQNIEKLSLENNSFRKVVYTAKNSQLVLMSLKPGEDIGDEVHDVDQFFRIEKGMGKLVIDGNESELADGSAVVVPANSQHNITNTGSEPLKLYTIYTPPHHMDGLEHITKAEAMADTEEHFDGKTTE